MIIVRTHPRTLNPKPKKDFRSSGLRGAKREVLVRAVFQEVPQRQGQGLPNEDPGILGVVSFLGGLAQGLGFQVWFRV